jgi:pSer/pThr/pTyr-binding forkhead associated (FHA) protein
MIDTLVHDFIDAATKLDREAFCSQLPTSVLIAALPESRESFQSDPTRMLTLDDPRTGMQANPLDRSARVLELRSMDPKPNGLVSIGRSEDNDIVLQDETVSAKHATFLIDPELGHPGIQDLESTNGTWINETQMTPWRLTKLRDGDALAFGDASFFFYTPAGLHTALLTIS